MKWSTVLLLVCCLQLSAFAKAQYVSLTVKNAPLRKVLNEIKRQSGYLFFYNDELAAAARPVTISVKNEPVEKVLEACFRNQPFGFSIIDKTIVVERKPSVVDSATSGQQTKITGTVVNASNGKPLSGATVTVRGKDLRAATAADGSFELEAQNGDVLVISYVGFETYYITVGKEASLSIQLQEKPAVLNDMVVVGYRSVKKADLTGSVTAIGALDFNVGVMTAPTDLMQGRVAGVTMIANGGEPGAAPMVRVRGSNSVRSGQDPLYVVDGVPLDITDVQPGGASVGGVGAAARKNPLNFLNPDDIESITVLKDASATAIYGSRGANGVIMVTTKKGKRGKGKLAYAAYLGISELPEELPMLDAETFRNFRAANGATGGDMGANTNWQKEIFRTATSQNHSLSFGGGNEQSAFRASLSYMNQEGIIRRTGLEKYTGRVNFSHNAFDNRLKLEGNLTAARTVDQRVPIGETGGYEGDVLLSALKVNPTFPVYNPDGSYYQFSKDVRNPVAMINLTNDNTQTDRILGNIAASVEILKGLSYKLNLGLSNSNASRKVTQDNELIYLTNFGTVNINNVEQLSTLVENFLTYDFDMKQKHRFNLLAGHSYQKFRSYASNFAEDGFKAVDVNYLNNLAMGNYTKATVSSATVQNALQSFFGRMNYVFNEKYLLTATIRSDGSTKFGENNKYGWFPSASFAWKLNEEKFLQQLPAVSDLKLRVGWGITGNQEIPNKISQILLGTTSGAILDGSTGNAIPGLTLTRTPNPDIRWEKTTQYNLGIDFGFYNGRISGAIDLFHKTTDDVLLEVYSIAPAPTTRVWTNVPDMKIVNKGIELALNGVIVESKDFKWDAGINFTTIRNRVSDLPMSMITTGSPSGPGITGYSSQVIKSGESIGTFWGRKFIGFDETGNSMFEKDKDGKEIEQVLGYALPKFNYGFNLGFRYKGADLSLFFNGMQGNKVYNNTANIISQKTLIMKEWNMTEDALNQPENLNGTLTYSSRFIEDGSFFRLASATLGYSFNTSKLSWISRLRVYAAGNNLFVITPYKGYDPEVNADHSSSGVPSIGIDWTTYPRARTVIFGLNVEF